MVEDTGSHEVQMQWGIRIPLRDGIRLNGTLYLPKDRKTPGPALFCLTPYIAQGAHDLGLSYASHGYPFLAIDVRGRGNSEGEFTPLLQEAKDGHDVVEWVARQSWCNGKVAMCGGSYGGYDQWATVKEFPPHLATIVPAAAVCPGTDYPLAGNIFMPYAMQWLSLTWGRTAQDKLFWGTQGASDFYGDYWSDQYRKFLATGLPLRKFDEFLGNPSPIFQKWLSHPAQDAYWDSYNPTQEQYGKLALPILTITGHYDGDQPGALTHYRAHLKNAGDRAQHYLVMGPWDHARTRTPEPEFGGLKFGPASLVDLKKLHREWYAWTMEDGPKPEFLQKKVAYYVMGAETWRYADTLEAATARTEPLYLSSDVNPTDVFRSGSLESAPSTKAGPDHYAYDPLDLKHAHLQVVNYTDQRFVLTPVGKQLVYHGAPFEADAEISGFFRLVAWIAIDQPDTDFVASIYEIAADGSSILLTHQALRARYREGLREENLVRTTEPLRYDFDRFLFLSRRIRKGSRLRLVIGPMSLLTMFMQKNYNSGKPVADETAADARTVTVKLFHDAAHPSALYVPYGHPDPAG